MSIYEPKMIAGGVIILSGERRVEAEEEDLVVRKLKIAGAVPADTPIAPRPREKTKLPPTIPGIKPPPTILGVHMG